MGGEVRRTLNVAPSPKIQNNSSSAPSLHLSSLNMSEATPLESMATELVHQVCSHLSKGDIHMLRLSCKALYLKSRRQFAIAHFKQTAVLTTRDGLESAIAMAKNPEYGTQVKSLDICLVTFVEKGKCLCSGDPQSVEDQVMVDTLTKELVARRQEVYGKKHTKDLNYLYGRFYRDKRNTPEMLAMQERLHAYRRSSRKQQRKAYGTYRNDQYDMRKHGSDVKLLTELLVSLPALESIAVVDGFSDFRSSWGEKQLKEKLGRDSPWLRNTSDAEDFSYWSHGHAMVFGAIIRSGVSLKNSLALLVTPHTLKYPEQSDSRKLRRSGTPARTFHEEQFPELGPGFATV
jgi:hypothetical protein